MPMFEADPEPADVQRPVWPVEVNATLHFDGGCKPNPGDGRCGYVLQVDGRPKVTDWRELGPSTNNAAEYSGLIDGLQAAAREGVTHLHVHGDSQIVINGMQRFVSLGPRPGGKPHLEKLKAEAGALVARFQQVTFTWVRRHKNAEADALASTAGR
jgi:ribonuclease HI